MSMQAIVRGRVLAGPFRSETQSAELTVTMTLGDNQSALHRGREYLIDDLEVSEVICRGPWAAQVAESIFEGDALIVVGQIQISVPIDRYNDRNLVLVTIEADSLGIDIEASWAG